MSLHRALCRLRSLHEEHERGTRDGHEETAQAHRVLAGHLAEDIAAVEAAIATAAALADVREAVTDYRTIDTEPEWERASDRLDAALAATPADLATARDARVRAEALREAAAALDRGEYGRYPGTVYDWLRAEAERIERGGR